MPLLTPFRTKINLGFKFFFFLVGPNPLPGPAGVGPGPGKKTHLVNGPSPGHRSWPAGRVQVLKNPAQT